MNETNTQKIALVKKNQSDQFEQVKNDVKGDINNHFKLLNDKSLTEEQRRILAKNLSDLMKLRNDIDNTIQNLKK